MKINSKISSAVLSAATGLLQPYIPELSPGALIDALKAYDKKQTGHARPLTRDEAAELLSVSRATVDRYIREGRLQSVRVGRRLIRITSESVDALLTPGAEAGI